MAGSGYTHRMFAPPTPRGRCPSFVCTFALVLMSTATVPAQTPAPAETDDPLRAELASYPHRVVFETKRDGNWELYLMKADGSGMKNLTNTPDVHEINPKASPDGRLIAFAADLMEEGRKVRDLYYMKADGSDRKKIADDARDPCWSPDGKRIAYLPAEYGRHTTSTWATRGLRIYDLETGKTTDHPNGDIEHLYTLAWSPDAKYFIATVHGGMGYRQAIVAIEADGRRVHDLRLRGCRPDVSADGKRIAWGDGDFAIGVAELYAEDGALKTREARRVIYNRWKRGKPRKQTYHADWSPDGRYMLFSFGPKVRRRRFWGAMPQNPGEDAPGWDLCVADVKTGKWVQITNDGKSNKEADWVRVTEEDASK